MNSHVDFDPLIHGACSLVTSFLDDNIKDISSSHDTFNPFIHGTCSLILPFLDQTNMEIISPIEMMRKYQLSPLSGEIYGGGYDGLSSRHMGKVAFGKLKETYYDLDRVKTSYLNHKINKINVPRLIKRLHASYKKSFANINILLIELIIAKQTGQMTQEELETIQFQKIYEKMHATIQIWYLFLIFENHIFSNIKINSSTDRNEIFYLEQMIKRELSFEKLLFKIIDKKTNIADIYKSASASSLKEIEKLLEVPEEKTDHYKKTISLLNNQKIFITEHNIHIKKEYEYKSPAFNLRNISDFIFAFLKNEAPCAIDNFMIYLIQDKIPNHFFKKAKPYITNAISDLADRLIILYNIAKKDYKKEIDLLKPLKNSNIFPIILICENEEIIFPYAEEYRAKYPLKLGHDIQMIATNTRENKAILDKFFKERSIALEIILFTDLELSKKTNKRPEREYKLLSRFNFWNPSNPKSIAENKIFPPQSDKENLSLSPKLSDSIISTQDDSLVHILEECESNVKEFVLSINTCVCF